MFKQLLLYIISVLLVLLGIFASIFYPGAIAVRPFFWIGIVIVIAGLLLILLTSLSRRHLCYKQCFVINFLIILLGIGIFILGLFIASLAAIAAPAFFIAVGFITIVFALIIIALGILLVAEC
ncbi:hypothetical protein RJG79_05965 [Mycoplasmatota bacterium WC44]